MFLIDYGFAEREYYHPQRAMGTVMCHRAHRADDNPLADVGAKDITAHVNFTGIALAAQQAADKQAQDEEVAEAQAADNEVAWRLAASQGGVGGRVDAQHETVGDWHLLGYTSQARFLLNCGLAGMLEAASLAERSMANKLLMEHEMGELFKVIGFCRGTPWHAIGFAQGDRSHRL